MSRASIARRVDALEAPASLKTIQSWAAAYGWDQIQEWDRLQVARIYAKPGLLDFFHSCGRALTVKPSDEPIPEETSLERQYHEWHHAMYPPEPGTRAKMLRSLGLSETGEDLWKTDDHP